MCVFFIFNDNFSLYVNISKCFLESKTEFSIVFFPYDAINWLID